MTTATEASAVRPRVSARPVDVARVARNLGALALAALPGLLTIYLSFNSGGYFAEAQGAVAAVLAGIVVVRMAFLRDPFGGFSRSLIVAVSALAVYSLWSLLSSDWSHAPARSLLDFNLANVYLFTLILFGSSARSFRRVRWTVVLTCLAMLVVCAASLATRLRPDLFPIPASFSQNRLAFPLTYWNALGQFAVIGIILGLHLTSSTRQLRIVRVLAAAAIPVFSVTILLTFSRAALVLGAGGLIAYAVLARPRGLLGAVLAAGPTSALAIVETYQAKLIANADTSAAAIQQGRHLTLTILIACIAAALARFALVEVDTRFERLTVSPGFRHRMRVAFGAVCAVAAVAALVAFGGKIGHELSRVTKPEPAATANVETRISTFSFATRLEGWKVALKTFERTPLHGHGAGTYEIDYDQSRAGGGTVNPHSLYLQAMSELGVVGLIAIVLTVLVLVGTCFTRLRRSTRSLWVAIGVVTATWAIHAGVDWDWEMPAVTLPVFALAGCALARRGGGARFGPRPELVARTLVGVLALAVAFTALRISISDDHLSNSVTAFNQGNCPAAVVEARAAISAVSSRPQPYAIIGYCDILRRKAQPAVAEMSKAITRDPQDWRYRYGLAVASAAAGLNPWPAMRQAEILGPHEFVIQTAASTFAGHNRRQWREAAPGLDMPVSMRE